MPTEECVDQFITNAARGFREVRGKDTEIRRTLAMYIANGLEQAYSQGELIDFLGTSTPSVLDLAEFTDQEQLRAMEILGTLTSEEIAAFSR